MKFTEVWITCPSTDVAERIATEMVKGRFAACANVMAKVRSVYRWDGRVQNETEIPLVLKIRAADFDIVSARVTEMHPYETPAIVALPIERCNPAYSDWLIDSTERHGS